MCLDTEPDGGVLTGEIQRQGIPGRRKVVCGLVQSVFRNQLQGVYVCTCVRAYGIFMMVYCEHT